MRSFILSTLVAATLADFDYGAYQSYFSGYELAFEDDFLGTTLNSTVWTVCKLISCSIAGTSAAQLQLGLQLGLQRPPRGYNANPPSLIGIAVDGEMTQECATLPAPTTCTLRIPSSISTPSAVVCNQTSPSVIPSLDTHNVAVNQQMSSRWRLQVLKSPPDTS